jgi:uroporphyrinogen-III synthase
MEAQPLAGRTIAVPESRELEVFATLLERRGATVLRCPLISIRDAPDPVPVLEFARALAAGAFDDLILTTGEGLRRILSCIGRHEPQLQERFLAALARVRKVTRGPKPARALRELSLKADLAALAPTTQGIIESLGAGTLAGRRVAVQLYGTEPNLPLIGFLEAQGARVTSVAPYVYANAADDAAVRALVARLSSGGIDAIAFTSTPQVERLFALAAHSEVSAALARTLVAAVGPVVAATLRKHGVAALVMPAESFFLKPLTAALEEALRAPA